MSSSLKVIEQTPSVNTTGTKKDNVIAINPNANGLLQRLSSSTVGLA